MPVQCSQDGASRSGKCYHCWSGDLLLPKVIGPAKEDTSCTNRNKEQYRPQQQDTYHTEFAPRRANNWLLMDEIKTHNTTIYY